MFDEIVKALADVAIMIDGIAYAPVGFMAQEFTKFMVVWGLLFGGHVWLGYKLLNHLVEGAVLFGRLVLSKIRLKRIGVDD